MDPNLGGSVLFDKLFGPLNIHVNRTGTKSASSLSMHATYPIPRNGNGLNQLTNDYEGKAFKLKNLEIYSLSMKNSTSASTMTTLSFIAIFFGIVYCLF